MATIIGRNDPCPCGSGKKYKYCCLNKPDDPSLSNIKTEKDIEKIFKEIRRSAQFKQCLYPDHSECSEHIIKAHSIQNNKILKRISDNGEVYMPRPKNENIFSTMTEYGRKEATVFTGFCEYHDKIIFRPIEDDCFTKTAEQIFLYIYRAFAIEYHNKLEAVNMNRILFSRKPSIIKSTEFMRQKTYMEEGITDLDIEKEVFDNALLTKNYTVLTSLVWEFDQKIYFAASGLEAPTCDLTGKKLQNISDRNTRARHIFYSIFSDYDKTYAIIAWIKTYDELFTPIKTQLELLNETQRKNFINYSLPISSENIAINPTLWNSMSDDEKNEFRMYLLSFNEDRKSVV